ncbi:hypothetical protein C8C83_0680 [Flavobacterium sp. 90]|uniref:toxin-antitoxin system YwqK family antitoxin n=1 Tax=unclassified Flavobacterium TaxID=196869 RepID=UPI000F16FC25|nr:MULTISPECIES: hypothetical protein [unclassified Flavobacterium]RKR09080.1 hypothetical protein C8C82_0978 [Flavobacterium sp. 81]TCK52864.1 hypothetical protein C8C83_0680 [Flavobacterium sp. 90]
MKSIFLQSTFFIVLSFALLSFSDPYTVKRISDKDFRYEFFTTDKKIKPNKTHMYSWFKGGLIHETQGGIAGDLLNDKFIKMYHSNQLAEQGEFKNGLRVGIWKTWHQNGILATDQNWHNGLRSGIYSRFDITGNLVEKGRFVANYKTGKWIDTEKKDTVIYKKGKVIIQKPTFNKSEKYKIKQEKNNLENAKKEQKRVEALADADQLDNYKAKAKEEKAIAKEKAKKQNESEAAAKKEERLLKKQAREEAKKEPEKENKIVTFFKNLFKKKDKAAQ